MSLLKMSNTVISKESLLEKLRRLEQMERTRSIICKQYGELHKHSSKNNQHILLHQLYHNENAESKAMLGTSDKYNGFDKSHTVSSKSRSKFSTSTNLTENGSKSTISQTEKFITSNCKRELQKRILQYQHYVNNVNRTVETNKDKKSFPRMLEKQNLLMWQSYKAVNSDLVSQFDKMLIKLS